MKKRERTPSALEKKFQHLFDSFPDAIVLVDDEGLISQVNAQTEKMFGFTRAEVCGKPVELLLPPGLRGRHVQHRASFMAHPRVRPMGIGMELVCVRKGGGEFPAEIALSPIVEGEGTSVLVVIHDLTERKHAEAAMHESEFRYRTLVEMSPEAIVVHSNGEIVFANSEAAKLLEVESAEKLIGRAFLDFVPDEYKEKVLERIKRHAESNVPAEPSEPLSIRVERPDGETLFLEAIGSPVPFRGGRAAQVIIRNVTRQKRAETEHIHLNRALKAIGAANQTLVRATDEMAFLSDVCRIICEIGGYRMVWVGYAENGSGEKVRPIAWTGVEQGYLKRVTDSWGVAGAPKGPASIAIDTGKPSVIRDVRTLPASNPWRGESLSRKYLSILGLPLITGGKTLGAIGIYSSEPDTFDEEEIHLLSQLADDLAFGIVSLRAHRDREKAEAQLRVSSEQLRKLAAHLQTAREAERTHIAREIHDELGQALTALKMDLVWTEEVVRGTAEQVTPESILNKIEGMYTLIDNTIGTMRRIATELRPVLLDSLGLSAAMEWQAEEFQNRTGIVCRLEVEPEEFDVDRERSTAVFRILQEALTNVARHSEATIVVVTLQIDQGALCLSVKDNGKGIADVEQVRSDSFGLLGMRERVLLFGGNVTIDSGPGLGTKLDVRIPLPESGLRVSD